MVFSPKRYICLNAAMATSTLTAVWSPKRLGGHHYVNIRPLTARFVCHLLASQAVCSRVRQPFSVLPCSHRLDLTHPYPSHWNPFCHLQHTSISCHVHAHPWLSQWCASRFRFLIISALVTLSSPPLPNLPCKFISKSLSLQCSVSKNTMKIMNFVADSLQSACGY